jgi:hypothetical protein
MREGHARLASWLKDHDGPHLEASERAHLHWHMLVFELSVGPWQAAYRRFHAQLLPAVAQGHAAVDAPAALWWLRLRANAEVKLPWAPVQQYARAALPTERDPYTTLYHLLALAGAEDTEALEQWLHKHDQSTPRLPRTLICAGRAMRALTDNRCDVARDQLDQLLPELPRLGGSRAQNALFREIRDAADECAARRANDGAPLSVAA